MKKVKVSDQFTLITRQEAQDRLKCSHHTIDRLRRDGVLYSVNANEYKVTHETKYPHDSKFWNRMKARKMFYAVGIRGSDVEDYWNIVRKPFLESRSQAKLGAAMDVVPPVSHMTSGYKLPTEPKVKYPGIGVPVKGVAPFKRQFHSEDMILHQVSLQEEEHRRIEDMINMRLMQLETDLEFKLANEVKRIIKAVFSKGLNNSRKEIVYDICKDLRNEIGGMAEMITTNHTTLNHNMKRVWDKTKELDEKLSRTYVSFAEVQEKTWKHIKKAVKARTLKPKPSRVSLWRKFMTWALSPTNSTGNNTTEKVGKGKE